MFLIDGHNLIGTGLIPGIHLYQEDDEARLVAWLRARQPNLRKKMVIVFDGGIPGGTSLALSGGGVTAIFASQRRTNADRVIISRVQNAPRPADIVVVSNDAALRAQVQHAGARIMRVQPFLQKIQRPQRAPTTPSTKERPHLSRQEIDEFLRLFGEEN